MLSVWNSLIKLLDVFYANLAQTERKGIRRYLLTLVLIVTSLLARFVIAPENAGLQFITFFPAVALSAVLFGTGPGLLATAFGATLGAYFFFAPYQEFSFDFQHYTAISLLIFCTDGLIISLSIGAMQRYFFNYIKTVAKLETALEQSRRNEAELSYQKFALDQHSIVAATDVRGTITYVNDLFCDISQYSREELIGQNHRLINSGTHPVEFFRTLYRTIASGRVWKGDICNRARDGSLYWVSTTIVPYVNDSGKPERYVAIRTDITDLHRAEEKAQAALLAKSQFLANMSHEIRTPMNAILGLTRIVLESDLKPEQRAQLDKVSRSGRALVHIINDILDFSRIEAGRMRIERAPMRVDAVLLEIAELFGMQAEEKGLKLFLDIDHATPTQVMGDALRLTQVLNNLVGNAIKFTQSGEIHVSTRLERHGEDGVTLCFSVLDTGIGISAEQIGVLFQPFSQADASTTRKYGGSGLGLVIVKKLVELMGGQITLDSTPGRGTNVTFCIEAGMMPETVVPSLPHAGNGGELARAEMGRQRFDGVRVLLVEDNELNQEIADSILRKRGVCVTLAWHGLEAVELVQQQPFDLVLMDLHMPVMGGIEATRRIRELAPELPIVAMTAAVMAEDRERCNAIGMNDFIAKPTEPEDIVRILSTYTQAATPLPAVPVTLPAETLLDLAQGLCRLDGDHALQQRLLRSFVGHYHDLILHLDTLLNDGNTRDAIDLIHSVKGIAANLGATALAGACHLLLEELRAQEQPLSRTAFDAALTETLAQMRQHIASYLQPAQPDTASVPMSLAQALQSLEPLILNQEVPPDALLLSLRRLSHADLPCSPLLLKLLRQLDNFEHPEALTTFNQLKTQHQERQ